MLLKWKDLVLRYLGSVAQQVRDRSTVLAYNCCEVRYLKEIRRRSCRTSEGKTSRTSLRRAKESSSHRTATFEVGDHDRYLAAHAQADRSAVVKRARLFSPADSGQSPLALFVFDPSPAPFALREVLAALIWQSASRVVSYMTRVQGVAVIFGQPITGKITFISSNPCI